MHLLRRFIDHQPLTPHDDRGWGMHAFLIGMVALTTALTTASPGHAACGEKGGPGYRGPNGKCVGWAQIGRVCGTPPETRCTPEMAHPNAADASSKGGQIQQMLDNAHREINSGSATRR